MSDVDDYLDKYLAEHHERYTREALTKELIEAGNDPAAVEAAWARLAPSAEAAAPNAGLWPPGSAESGERGIGSSAGSVLATIVIVCAYGASILAAGAAAFFGGAVTVLMIAYVIAMGAGLVYSLRRLDRATSARDGAEGVGIVFVISVLIFIGLSGTCFVLLGPAISNSNIF